MERLQMSRWGTVTALGDTVTGFEALCAGRTGLSAEGRPAWAASVPGPLGMVVEAQGPPRTLGLARVALRGLDVDPVGLAVIVATTGGGMVESEPFVGEFVRGEGVTGPREFFWDALLHRVAVAIAADLGATGPVMAVSTACTSGTVAVGVGADMVRAGRARRALVVGADALCRTSVYGFGSLGVRSSTTCRPFDHARDGMCIGEGAGFVLIEPLAPGAWVELLGVGVANDAYHLTAPHPEGRGLADAVARALGGARTVDHVNAHGTGTLANDALEAALLPRLLPGAAVSATKGATGHALGAAGVVELVFLVQSMLAGVIPPVAGLRDPLPVDVSAVVRHRRQEVGVSVNLAFGGHNAAVAVRRLA